MKSTLGVIAIIMLILLVGVGFWASFTFFRPMSPALELKTLPTATVDISQVVLQQATATAAPKKQTGSCGMSGSMVILNLGLSTELPLRPPAAESIRLVRFDIDQSKVMVFTLPRDLVVQTPALKDLYQIEQSQLGDIYAVVLQAEKSSTDPENAGFKATQAMAQVIYDTFGVTADHYISMENDVMWQSIDTLDGITVKVKQDFKAWDGAPYNGLEIPKGEQVLDGLQAHAFYTQRDRSPQEWDRTDRQNAVFEGLYARLLNANAIPKIPELYQLFKDKIVTDLSPSQIVSMGCLVNEIPINKSKLDEVAANEVVIQSDGSFLLKDLDKTRKKILKFLEDK